MKCLLCDSGIKTSPVVLNNKERRLVAWSKCGLIQHTKGASKEVAPLSCSEALTSFFESYPSPICFTLHSSTNLHRAIRESKATLYVVPNALPPSRDKDDFFSSCGWVAFNRANLKALLECHYQDVRVSSEAGVIIAVANQPIDFRKPDISSCLSGSMVVDMINLHQKQKDDDLENKMNKWLSKSDDMDWLRSEVKAMRSALLSIDEGVQNLYKELDAPIKLDCSSSYFEGYTSGQAQQRHLFKMMLSHLINNLAIRALEGTGNEK